MKGSFFAIFMQIFLFPIAGFSLSYDWKYDLDGTVTRCFKSENVKVHCEDFSDPERGKKLVEELQIEASDFWKRKFSYSYEQGISGTLCREHFGKIRSLMRGAKEVCITGGLEFIPENEKITISKWQALETRKGKVER